MLVTCCYFRMNPCILRIYALKRQWWVFYKLMRSFTKCQSR